MPHQYHIWSPLCAAAVLALTSFNLAHAAPFMIVGNDEKLLFDGDGKPLLSAPGKDSVVILDLADPEGVTPLRGLGATADRHEVTWSFEVVRGPLAADALRGKRDFVVAGPATLALPVRPRSVQNRPVPWTA